ERLRVVSCFLHVLDSSTVCIHFTRGCSKFVRNQKTTGLAKSTPEFNGWQHDRGTGTEVETILHAVTRNHEFDLVSNDAGDLCFIVYSKNQAAVDIQKAARERNGVDLI